MRTLGIIGLVLILIAVAGAVYLFGGFFNVAASEPHTGVMAWAVERVRHASIEHHARGTPPIPLDDQAAIQEGARAYARLGCANCHGGPGTGWAKFSEGLNPGPPDLKETASKDEPAEIFWIVKHGISMTGMPSFAKAGASDDEIARVTAFVKRLPSVTEADYKAWTAQP